MTFLEINFLVFLIAGIALFYICPVKFRWIALLIISIVFYAIAGVKYLPFIFVTSLSVYLGGLAIGNIYKKQKLKLGDENLSRQDKKQIKEADKKKAHKFLLLVLIINLAILCVVKYTKFFVNPINDLIVALGSDATFSASYIIVPLGISYYTFSSLSYILDVYWKRVEYEPNYFRFLLYLIYFPHILQGPIERYGRLGQRLKQELRFDYDRVISGIQLMIWGYFKKVVIADGVDSFITNVYSDYKTAGGAIIFIAAMLDVVFIYADFSGCMDIARGVSQIFGVELDLNFNHPFSSKSIVEFWRRWHMSLGSWFKDYVYFPVSTSKLVKNIHKKTKAKCSPKLDKAITATIPVAVTWVLTGVWHGTGLPYIAWGVYYAFMIFMSVTFGEDFTALGKKLKINNQTTTFKMFQAARTTLIFAGGRFLTRPGSLTQSKHILAYGLKHLKLWCIFDDTIFSFGIDIKHMIVLAVAIALFGYISHLQIKKGSVREVITKQGIAVRWVLSLALIFAIIIFGTYGPGYDASSFVYMAY